MQKVSGVRCQVSGTDDREQVINVRNCVLGFDFDQIVLVVVLVLVLEIERCITESRTSTIQVAYFLNPISQIQNPKWKT
jgi:hypothetical protein